MLQFILNDLSVHIIIKKKNVALLSLIKNINVKIATISKCQQSSDPTHSQIN